MAPFWRGEATGRSYDLGLAQGKFLRTLSERLDQPDCLDWLQRDYFLDGAAARNLRNFVERQVQRTKCVPTDRTLVIEASRDPLGDWQVILLSPLGRGVNLSLRLALEYRLHQRLGYRPQCLHHDDGVLIRLTESDEPVLDLFDGITPENVRDMILEELADSALFALRFRQNAARALMMPRGAAGKRAPLWLQRLRGRDLLQVARRNADFPIVAETFRECLHDHLDLPHLQQLLVDIAAGNVRRRDTAARHAVAIRGGSAVRLHRGVHVRVRRRRGRHSNAARRRSIRRWSINLSVMRDDRCRSIRAVQQVDRRLRGVGHPPRSKAETAEWLRHLGDVAPREVEGAVSDFLGELERDGVVARFRLPHPTDPERWILTEEMELYRSAFAADAAHAEKSQIAAMAILRRFLETHALIGLDDVLARYPFERKWAQDQLEAWTQQGRLVRVVAAEAEPLQWSAPDNFDQMQRSTLSILRREVMACPAAQFADFVVRWQHVHPTTQAGLAEVLPRLQGFSLPLELWEQAILPMRVKNYAPRQLDELIGAGEWTWHCRREGESEMLAFVERDRAGASCAAERGRNAAGSSGFSDCRNPGARGALFSAEIAGCVNLSEATTRSALWSLLRAGLATNDQFDILRRGEPPRDDQPPPLRSRGEVRLFAQCAPATDERLARRTLVPYRMGPARSGECRVFPGPAAARTLRHRGARVGPVGRQPDAVARPLRSLEPP